MGENAQRIRIAILDDDVTMIDRIKKTIVKSELMQKYQPIFVSYVTVNELRWDIEDKSEYFQIYLLDIQVGQDNGLELAKYIRDRDAEAAIIFLTSYMEYSIEGYECSAYRYILKSQFEEKLLETLSGLFEKLKSGTVKTYFIDGQYSMEKIEEKDIIYLYKEGKYTYFSKECGMSRERKAMSEVLDSLTRDQFVLIEKGCAVNLEHVMSIHNLEVIMRNGEKLFCSRKQIGILKEKVRSYWGMK